MQAAWPAQIRLLDGVREARKTGCLRILASLPTGLGKTYCAATLVREEIEAGGKAVFFTNRRMLMSQSSDVFGDEYGLEHGMRAAGHPKHRWLPFQIASIQSELSWLKLNTKEKPDRHQLHDATLAIWDEAHLNASAGAVGVMNHYVRKGCANVGLTATPVDLAHAYDTLVVGGSNSDGRACGALVPVKRHFCPTEPDFRQFKGLPEGEDVSEAKAKAAIMANGIFGHVYDGWVEGNPDGRPTIGFGPGVAESQWFAEEFHKKGVRCAHIDGDNIWVNGDRHASDSAAREQVIDDHRRGRIPVLWNRYILREGLDLKWAEYGILATIFGSIQTYLQVGGRFLRSCKETGKTHATIQDHGGHWHRLGSLNADQDWKLEYTGKRVVGMRLDRIRAGKEREPFCCPRCRSIMRGQSCVCGYEITRRSRPVIQSDGKLVDMEGEIYKKRKIDTRSDAEKRWTSAFWRSRKSKNGMSFKQCLGLFHKESGWKDPPPGLPFMPTRDVDWYRRVRDVDFSLLTPKQS